MNYKNILCGELEHLRVVALTICCNTLCTVLPSPTLTGSHRIVNDMVHP